MADRLDGQAEDIMVAASPLSSGWCALCGDDVCAGVVFHVYLPH